jgi:nicotinamide mononucleotide transporter PnuC
VLLLLEIGAVCMILLYIYYAAQQKPLAWLFGIAASVLSAVLFYFQHYWGSLFLNLIYCVQGILGYLNWKFVLEGKPIRQSLNLPLQMIAIAILSFLGYQVYQYLLKNTTLELNVFDCMLAAISIYATWLEIKKEMACWNIWILANLSYAVLYFVNATSGSMYLYSALMLFLAMFSFKAKRAWQASLSESKS